MRQFINLEVRCLDIQKQIGNQLSRLDTNANFNHNNTSDQQYWQYKPES